MLSSVFGSSSAQTKNASKRNKAASISKDEVEALERALHELRSINALLSTEEEDGEDDGSGSSDDGSDDGKKKNVKNQKKKSVSAASEGNGKKITGNDSSKPLADSALSPATAASSSTSPLASSLSFSFYLPLQAFLFIIMHCLTVMCLQNYTLDLVPMQPLSSTTSALGSSASGISGGGSGNTAGAVRFTVCPASTVPQPRPGTKMALTVLDTTDLFPHNLLKCAQLLPEIAFSFFSRVRTVFNNAATATANSAESGGSSFSSPTTKRSSLMIIAVPFLEPLTVALFATVVVLLWRFVVVCATAATIVVMERKQKKGANGEENKKGNKNKAIKAGGNGDDTKKKKVTQQQSSTSSSPLPYCPANAAAAVSNALFGLVVATPYMLLQAAALVVVVVGLVNTIVGVLLEATDRPLIMC